MYNILYESEMFFLGFLLAMEGLHKLKPRCGSHFLMLFEKTEGGKNIMTVIYAPPPPQRLNHSFTKDYYFSLMS